MTMTRAGARPGRLMAALALSGLLLTACGTASGSTVGPTTSPSVIGPTALAVPSAQAPAALEFSGTTLDGAAFSGPSLAGKPAVLWFWAPWCTICRGEGPDIARLSAEYAGRVQFVGIPGLGSVDDMKGFVSDTGTGNFTHVSDLDGSLWARFGVSAQPAFVFVTRQGDAQRFLGGISADDLRSELDKLIAA